MITTTHYPRRAGPPAAEPLTLAQALVHLREEFDAGANDAYITSLISVARTACEDRTERTLITTPWVLTLDAFPAGGVIALAQGPVQAVQSVQYLDALGNLQLLDASAYALNTTTNPARLQPAPATTWPATQPSATAAVRVAYTAGYGSTAASVPAPLVHWMLLALGSLYNTREASATQPQVGHAFVDHLLNPYREMGV